jgi:O-antigen ligase
MTNTGGFQIAVNVKVAEADSFYPQERSFEKSDLFQWTLMFGLCALLIYAVLAFGSVYEWSIFWLEAGSLLLFLLWAARQLKLNEIRFSKNPIYLPAVLFAGLVLAQILLHRTAYWYITKYEAGQYVAYGIALFIAAECVRSEQSRKRFAQIMIAFGVLYAFFAIAQELTFNGKIFWFHSPHFHSSAIYGSYVNRDHYAGLMEMLVPIPLVVGFGHVLKGGQRALIIFCTVLMASTIFLSGSRGGMIAFVIELVMFATLAFRTRRRPRAVFGLAALCACVLAFLVFVGRGHVLFRLGDLQPGIRLQITNDSMRMFLQRPILGWGLGTFPTVYPAYRSFYTNLFVNEAHNDYAQLLVETGLIGFALMLWFLFRLYQRGLPTSRRWEFKWDGALSLAALLGCTGMLFHSLVDFNLQIPANATFFYVLCALAASELPASSSRSKARRGATTAEESSVSLK